MGTLDVMFMNFSRIVVHLMLSCACKMILMQESERVVSKKEGIDFAREYGCLFLECSAKTRVNVEQCFEELVLKVHIVEALFVFFKTFLHLHLFCKKLFCWLLKCALLLTPFVRRYLRDRKLD